MSFTLFALVLAACSPPSPQTRVVTRPAASAAPVDMTPGFDEKEPDTCKAKGLQGLIGQPSGNLRTVPLPGPVRMILPGRVVDQEEYRSDRINAHLDSAGLITKITCG